MKTRLVKFILAGILSGVFFIANAQQKAPSQIHSFTAKEAVDYALKNTVQVKKKMVLFELLFKEFLLFCFY